MARRDPIPMTPDGHKRLQKELRHLKAVERPKNVEDIERARALGDLSENAEYHAAKERQGLLARKIAEVEDNLARAQVIDPKQLDHHKVVFGATVNLRDVDSGESLVYQIVGGVESDVKNGKISIDSPLARALIGKEKGDSVTCAAPGGTRELEILEIRFQ